MTKLIKALLVCLGLFGAAPAIAITGGSGTLLSDSFKPTETLATLAVDGSGSFNNFTDETVSGTATFAQAVVSNGSGSLDNFTDETVSGTVTFAQAVVSNGLEFSLQLLNIVLNNGDSAWHVNSSPVPEPESYVMLLAGLGLMGFVAHRRKS